MAVAGSVFVIGGHDSHNNGKVLFVDACFLEEKRSPSMVVSEAMAHGCIFVSCWVHGSITVTQLCLLIS